MDDSFGSPDAMDWIAALNTVFGKRGSVVVKPYTFPFETPPAMDEVILDPATRHVTLRLSPQAAKPAADLARLVESLRKLAALWEREAAQARKLGRERSVDYAHGMADQLERDARALRKVLGEPDQS